MLYAENSAIVCATVSIADHLENLTDNNLTQIEGVVKLAPYLRCGVLCNIIQY